MPTNAFTMFPYEKFGKFGFSEMPKGDFLRFAVNPSTGMVVLSYLDTPEALVVADDLLYQLFTSGVGHEYSLADYIEGCDDQMRPEGFSPCPFCGGVPSYVPSPPAPVKLSASEFNPGFIRCCGGRLMVDGFGSKIEAVRYWNERYGKVA